MLRSWKIGRAFGIPVYVHPSFLLAPTLVLLVNRGGGSLAASIFLVAMVVAVYVCVILHEFGHALMARYFGFGTRDITIYPIGGVARLEGMSEQPHEEMLIAVAGPAVNVVIAAVLTPIVFIAFMTLSHDSLESALGNGKWPAVAQFAIGLWISNVGLVLFNLIPAFPMDGGRVLRALLSMGLGFPRATEVAARIGMALAFLMGVGGLFMTPPMYMMPILALFVVVAGQQELMSVRYREAMRLRQRQMSYSQLPHPIFESPAVGQAVEVNPPASAEPRLMFQFRVIEIPEPPR